MSDNVIKPIFGSSAAKEDAVALGIAYQKAKDFFAMLGMENTATDPAERAAQIERYERARADLAELMGKHKAALDRLGRIP